MSRCSSCTKMKMLSTPTASTRKGITSMMMRVAETPAYEHVPNAAATDNNTMITPTMPTVNFASTNILDMDLNCP